MKPPGNGAGMLLHTPDGKLTGLSEDTSLGEFAQRCTHPVARTERFPGGVPHYAHEVCATCGCHVRWFPKPATIERRRLNSFKLAKLGMCAGLSPWEREFVASVLKRKKLSPRQSVVVDRLVAKYLEAPSP
jgi:hypothetical protein